MSSRSSPFRVRARFVTAVSISCGVAIRIATQHRSLICWASRVRSAAGTFLESRTFQRRKARLSALLATTTATTNGPMTHPRPASSTPANRCMKRIVPRLCLCVIRGTLRASMARIVVFGAGYIGEKAAAFLPDAVLSLARIDDPAQVQVALEEHAPEVVVNCAGKVGKPNVDWCETHQAETFRGNTIAPLVLAEACAARDIHLVHLGTGCIFYGPSPDPVGWREDDFANPSAVYTRSKYAADLCLSRYPNVAILRLRMPIDSAPVPQNLITKLSQYSKIIDVENSVTIVSDLLQAIQGVVEKKGTGVFHAVNDGTMKHRDLIALYEALVDPTHTNEWITEQDLVAQGLAAKKRSNCILQNRRLPELGIHMRPIEEALRETMLQYAAAIKAQRVLQ